MSKHLNLLVCALGLLAAGAAVSAPNDLLFIPLTLQANVPVETGLRLVQGAPAPVTRFKIYQTGNYCDIALDYIQYTTFDGDTVHQASHLPDGWAIPEGQLYQINIAFTQRTWDHANCDLTVRAVDNVPTSPGVWFDLRTVRDGDVDYTRRCGRTIRESLEGVQCYLSQTYPGEFFCKDPKQRKALLQQFSCVKAVYGPSLEPGYSIDWNQPL